MTVELVTILCWTALVPAAPQEAKPRKAAEPPAKKTGSVPDIDWSKLQLPREDYAEKLRTAVAEEKDSAGLRAAVSMVPNAYRYYMALGFEELKKASYGKVELKKKLAELYAKHKGEKGKALFFVTLSSDGGKNHHFLQSAAKDHVVLKDKTKRTISISGEDPKPGFAQWRVFEQQANQRNMLQKKLSELTKFSFRFTTSYKEGEKEPMTLSFKDLVRVTDRREEQKTDFRAFEGINVGLRQISSSDWKSQIVPEIQFALYPGRWHMPDPPEGFDELLSALENS